VERSVALVLRRVWALLFVVAGVSAMVESVLRVSNLVLTHESGYRANMCL
jgi:hypothetical protein